MTIRRRVLPQPLREIIIPTITGSRSRDFFITRLLRQVLHPHAGFPSHLVRGYRAPGQGPAPRSDYSSHDARSATVSLRRIVQRRRRNRAIQPPIEDAPPCARRRIWFWILSTVPKYAIDAMNYSVMRVTGWKTRARSSARGGFIKTDNGEIIVQLAHAVGEGHTQARAERKRSSRRQVGGRRPWGRAQ